MLDLETGRDPNDDKRFIVQCYTQHAHRDMAGALVAICERGLMSPTLMLGARGVSGKLAKYTFVIANNVHSLKLEYMTFTTNH